jgi:MGT family glycosyltransferase
MPTSIFWGFPAHGHTNPSLPLVSELVHRGEQVYYYSLEEFQPAIERTGATFRNYGTDFPLLHILTGPQDPARTTYGLARTSQWILDRLLGEVDALKPDYMLFDALCPWGSFAAQVLHLPTVCSQTGMAFTFQMVLRNPSSIFGLLRAQVTGREYTHQCQTILDTLSKQYHLKKMRPFDLFAQSGMLTIIYTSKLFQPFADSFDPQRYTFVGPALMPRPEAPAFPFEALEKEKPLIYISLGTASNNRPEFFRACIEALGGGDWQIVMAVGTQVERSALGTIPGNFIVRAFVPQLEILPRASLFLTHGGMNSINEALSFDVPLVVVPQMADQFWVAKRVEELGAGKRLPLQKIDAALLRRVAEEVLFQPAYAQAAARVGKSLREAGGQQKATDEIQLFQHAHHIV